MTKVDNRLKFYGLNDMGTFMQLDRLKEILDSFDTTRNDYELNQVLEYNNALSYLDNIKKFNGISSAEEKRYSSLKPHLYKLIANYFGSIDASNLSEKIAKPSVNYHGDMVALLVKNGVQDKIPATTLLPALKASRISLSRILENKQLVSTYDSEIRDLINSEVKNAEIIIGKLLEKSSKKEVNLPASFSPADATSLIDKYIDDEDNNPNYLELVANSRPNKSTGINAKLKLKAKQRHDAWTNEFFKDNQGGIAFGIGVSIVDDQEEPLVVVTEENQTTKFAYSRKWLDKNRDPAAIVGVFISLFQFIDSNSILSLPAYTHELGVFERLMMKGKDAYPKGVAFQFKEITSFYQTLMYDHYLRGHDTNLELVIEWFFNEYLSKTYHAEGLKYTPSTQASTYLEKCRHVFAEMDSVIKQFSLFVENGELDQELLRITSESYAYADIPSLVDNKYAYPADDNTIIGVLHHLYSDQSSITYISEDLKGGTLPELLTKHTVKYSDFHHYQTPIIDELINVGVLKNTNDIIEFVSPKQVAMLRKLFRVGAINYNLVSPEARVQIDAMVTKGWLKIESSLLTKEESSLFNYYLNQKDFSDGLDLRNKYLHGSQGSGDDETEHYKTYIIALELLIILVLKIDNDFSLKRSSADK